MLPVHFLPMNANDIITLRISRAQAERLAVILDDEMAANKNRLVTATVTSGAYKDQALPLARLVESDNTIRASMRRQGVA